MPGAKREGGRDAPDLITFGRGPGGLPCAVLQVRPPLRPFSAAARPAPQGGTGDPERLQQTLRLCMRPA